MKILNGTRLSTFTRISAGAGTYYTPAGCRKIEFFIVGTGGCGSGSGTSIAAGGNGGVTTFGPITCNGGFGGPAGVGYGGAGGDAVINAPAYGVAVKGSYGQAGTGVGTSVTYAAGGAGGSAPFFGGGGGGGMAANPGQPGTAPGSGGAGGGAANAANAYAGNGGGSGGFAYGFYDNPPPSIPYSIGAVGVPGAGSPGGTSGGLAFTGEIWLKESY